MNELWDSAEIKQRRKENMIQLRDIRNISTCQNILSKSVTLSHNQKAVRKKKFKISPRLQRDLMVHEHIKRLRCVSNIYLEIKRAKNVP